MMRMTQKDCTKTNKTKTSQKTSNGKTTKTGDNHQDGGTGPASRGSASANPTSAAASSACLQRTDGAMVIVPGFQARPRNHWFPWLARICGEHGLPCAIVDLPNPENPVCKEWTSAIDRTCAAQNGPLILVAHSLGCVALLKTMALHPDDFRGCTRRIVMVSGFLDPTPVLPDVAGIGDFALTERERAVVHALLPKSMTVVHSDDDLALLHISEPPRPRLISSSGLSLATPHPLRTTASTLSCRS